MLNIKYLEDENIENKVVLLRLDLNVPLKNNIPTDTTRIESTIPTIKYLLERKNKVIILTHLGRPKGIDPNLSTKILLPYLQKVVATHKVEHISKLNLLPTKSELKDDTVYLFENTRFFPEEKENDKAFAQELASHADVYINDAFSVSHRDDLSITGLPLILESYAGLLFRNELLNLGKLLNNPPAPFTAVIGGAKISTKLLLISKLLKICDKVILGGGLANTLLKASGVKIGKSICEEGLIDESKKILLEGNKKLVLPIDAICATLDPKGPFRTTDLNGVKQDEAILDIGPKSSEMFSKILHDSKTIVWNGPMGMFEDYRFKSGTNSIYNSIINNLSCMSIIGGGDTISAINNNPDKNKISYISTSGGAMLEFIEKGTLPGVDALCKN